MSLSTMSMSDYLTIVPRGLQDVLRDLLPIQLRENSPSGRHVVVQNMHVIGEDPEHYDADHLRDLQNRLVEAVAKKASKRQKLDTGSYHVTLNPDTKMMHGSIFDSRSQRHVSIGYDQGNPDGGAIWSIPGTNVGTCWFRFSTNAPPETVASIRCIGPLLAMVHLYTTPELPESMGDVLGALRTASSGIANWDSALSLWQQHLEVARGAAPPDPRAVDSKLRYRCSCVRDDSKRYSYARHELLKDAVKYLSPPGTSERWNVSLNEYDLEIVWLLRPFESVMAISLRDPVRLQASSFDKGNALPPDITPPYLPDLGGSKIVRLRPTTAQLLLAMAKLQPGDVVIDPCAGIGTIPLECLHLMKPPHLIAMGGDLALTDSLRHLAIDFERRTRTFLQGRGALSHFAMLCAWDARRLPLAPASVDVIVSDLPFGHKCLSANLLRRLIPLMLKEFARVLKPSTGRMILLCGNPQVLLDSLYHCNKQGFRGSVDSPTSSVPVVWELPVRACRPVNIGGHPVWILRIHRA